MAELFFASRKGLLIATIGRGSLDPRPFYSRTHIIARVFFMQRVVFGFVFLVGLIPGCGGGAISEPSKFTSAPHGGNIVELPDSLGFVELKTEIDPAAKGARTKGTKSRIVAYFLQPDTTTAMSPPPTDVKVTLGAAGSGAVVNLLPQSEGTRPVRLRTG